MIVLIFLLVLILILCAVGLIRCGRRNYGILENCGFPVITPTLFLGSDPKFYDKVLHLEDVERFKKYGPIWGLYLGQIPHVYVCDPELIRLILMKDFEHFHNRREVDFGSKILNEILAFLPDEKWRTVRSMLSPLFTTAKLKTMTGGMDALARKYVGDLKVECSKVNGRLNYDCKRQLSTYLVDMFAQTTLGVKLKNRKNMDNKFVTAFNTMLGENIIYGPLYSLSQSFPFLTAFAPSYDDKPTELIESTFRNILNSRATAGIKKSNDFVDILNEIRGKVDTEEFQKLGISETTVLAQATDFFISGFDTSSTTLAFLFYHLAKDPLTQQKLYEEIDSTFGSSDANIDHESLKDEKTPYLTACLFEVLRLAPQFKLERLCTKTWTHNGIQIKKGTEVYIATWVLHRNPEYYADHEEFQPERFLPENKASINQYAFAAFGFGNRNCIAQRFAFVSLKIFLIHFLLNFKIEMRPDTQLSYKKGCLTLIIFKSIHLDIIAR